MPEISRVFVSTARQSCLLPEHRETSRKARNYESGDQEFESFRAFPGIIHASRKSPHQRSLAWRKARLAQGSDCFK
jgi:hypothetical protein